MPSIEDFINGYLKELGAQLDTSQSTPELSLRNALHNLLQAVAEEIEPGALFTGEPSKEVYGQPDFIVTYGLLEVGHIEAEKIDADLKGLTGSSKEQNDRFIRSLDNFLQTNHLDFRLFRFGKHILSAKLPDPRTSQKPTKETTAEFKDLLEQFLLFEAPPATSTAEIAEMLAKKAHLLRAASSKVLQDPDSVLHTYLEAFRRTLYEELDEDRFADLYAQTFAYGLFLSWLEHPQAVRTPLEAISNIPKAVPPIRVLLRFGAGDELPDELRWIAESICRDLSRADPIDALTAFKGKKDPLIHFYEHFLAKYDPKLRDSRGVYYTPDEVVSFIVRSVDEMLMEKFGNRDGLADRSVLLLDPAVGTATFLAHCYRLVHDRMIEKGEGGFWPSRVRDHLLTHFFGFEIMPAAYTLAHLKCRFLLADYGVDLGEEERLPIYLTNSLERGRTVTLQLPGMAELARETRDAYRVKYKEPILVVLGNPPYSGHSMNPGRSPDGQLTEIGKLVQDYYQIDGEPIAEDNSKWLQDDYVKFIRFAQDRIVSKTGSGIVAFVTNHGYLANPTFRGMRKSLLESFHELYFLDLHGNSLRREKAPDGSADQNVFAIKQGVAICLLIRRDGEVPATGGRVMHADLWGTRQVKYEALDQSSVLSVKWEEIQPSAPHYLFVPQDTVLLKAYNEGWSVKDIFPTHSLGITTARDRFCIALNKEEMWNRVQEFVELSADEARDRYQLGKDATDWKVEWAKRDVLDTGKQLSRIHQVAYRPFDIRWTFFTGHSQGFHCRPRGEVMQHLLDSHNVALVVTRSIETSFGFEHSWVTNTLATHHVASIKEVNYVMPLRIYSPLTNSWEVNIATAFLSAIADQIGVTPSADHVFAYVYAVLWAPQYRAEFDQFLRTDFPRIPMPSSKEQFTELAQYGTELIDLHLLSSESLEETEISFSIAGSHMVASIRDRFRENEDGGKVMLNEVQFFGNVRPDVWLFRVGGQVPAAKWLDDRIGMTLSETEIRHYRKVLAAIRSTLDLLPSCDSAFRDLAANKDLA